MKKLLQSKQSLNNQYQKLLSEKTGQTDVQLLNEKRIKTLKNKEKKVHFSLIRLHMNQLTQLPEMIESAQVESLSELMEKIPEAMIEVMMDPAGKELLAYLKEAAKCLNEASSAIDEQKGEMARQEEIIKTKAAIERVDEDIETFNRQYQSKDSGELIKKLSSMINRPVFDARLAKNSVQASGTLNNHPMLDISFDQLTDKQKESLRNYIRDNARLFKTRLSRRIRQLSSHRLDLPATLKKACSTGGVPMRLIYQKPLPNKTKLVLFLDISGSCREASEMMIYFMYTMQDVFPSGCRCYVFVNKLYDVSDIFENSHPDEAIQAVFQRVQTRGIYSDYGVPIHSYYKQRQSELTKDTLLFFIGDARNNARADALDDFKAITRRVKAAFWFNTESHDVWNTGDSIISRYGQYVKNVSEVLSVKDLLLAIAQI